MELKMLTVKMTGKTLFTQTYALLKLKHQHLSKQQLTQLTNQVLDSMLANNTLEQVK